MSKIAVYAGTFDPITNGHVDIIKRALSICDSLYVAVNQDSADKKCLFNSEQRISMVKEATESLGKSIAVESLSGLLVDFATELKAKILIRGLRAVSDYEYEAQMAVMNRELNSEIETIFLMTSKECSFISSSLIREIASYKGDVSKLVPLCVNKSLISRFS